MRVLQKMTSTIMVTTDDESASLAKALVHQGEGWLSIENDGLFLHRLLMDSRQAE